MTSKPAELYHVEQFRFCFAIHLPLEEQVEVALAHHEDPVAFGADAEPVPDNSDVELAKHEGGGAEA